jgi:hypothetical protein
VIRRGREVPGGILLDERGGKWGLPFQELKGVATNKERTKTKHNEKLEWGQPGISDQRVENWHPNVG